MAANLNLWKIPMGQGQFSLRDVRRRLDGQWERFDRQTLTWMPLSNGSTAGGPLMPPIFTSPVPLPPTLGFTPRTGGPMVYPDNRPDLTLPTGANPRTGGPMVTPQNRPDLTLPSAAATPPGTKSYSTSIGEGATTLPYEESSGTTLPVTTVGLGRSSAPLRTGTTSGGGSSRTSSASTGGVSGPKTPEEYAAWYNSLAASTRAFAKAPGSFTMPTAAETAASNAEWDAAIANNGLGFADGGPIEGPGGPRQDNLLIAASNGEFVVPADVVKFKGQEFFDKLIEKTREATGGPQEGGLPPQPAAPPPRPLGFADGGLVTDPNEDLYLQPSGSAGLETLPALGDAPAPAPAPSLGLAAPVPMSETEPIAPAAAVATAPAQTSGLGLADYKAARSQDDKTYLQSLPTAQKVGLMLESLGAGINGGPNPIDRLLDNKRKREVEFRNELRTNLATITTGMEAVRKLPPGKGREALIEQIVRSSGGDPAVAEALKAVGTEGEAQIRSTLSTIRNPRVQKMITDAVAGSANPREDALRLMGDKDFMDRAEKAADLDAMPGLTGKLRVISQAMEKMGLKTYTFAELAEQNGKLPKEYQLDDGEMAAAKRNQDGLQLFGLKSEKMLAEERAAASKRTEAEERSKDRKSEQENALRIAASLRQDPAPSTVTIEDPDNPGKNIVIDSRTRQKIGNAPAKQNAEKALPTPMVKSLTEAAETADATTRFTTTFKDEFAGKTVTGGLGNTAGRIFGDDTGQSQWWQDYELHQSKARNTLFGSALTKTEADAWEKSAINPRMDPKQVRENLKRRDELESRALDRLMRGAAAGGYNKEQIEAYTGRTVPAGDGDKAAAPKGSGGMEAQAKAAFGSYEPDKYVYGINPKTGKFARKLK